MRFRIGPWVYTVRIIAEPIVQDGVEIAGQSDEMHRRILLSAALPRSQRLDVLLHELRHCWLFHFARPRTEEEDCNFTATTTASAMADLDAQGGLAALMRLRPTAVDGQPLDEAERAGGRADADAVEMDHDPGASGGSTPYGSPRAAWAADVGEHVVPAGQLEHWETSASPHAGRAQCGVCESIMSSGSVVSSPPQWDFVLCGNIMHRTLYCPHCHHLQRWSEGCSASGEPNGAVAEGPVYVRGPEVDAFLTTYPRAVGLLPA